MQGIIDVLVILPQGIASPVEVCMLTGILAYFLTSWVCVIPFILWLLSAILVMISGGIFAIYHKEYVAAQDRRIKFTSQFLFGIRMVKMSAWDDHFVSVIDTLRKDEIKWMGKEGIFRSLIIFLNQAGGNITLVITIILVIVTRGVDPAIIFTVLFIMFSFQGPFQSSADLIMTLGVMIPNYIELITFVNRQIVNKNVIQETPNEIKEKALAIENGDFFWVKDQIVLNNINLSVKEKEKVFVIGMSSTFLKCLNSLFRILTSIYLFYLYFDVDFFFALNFTFIIFSNLKLIIIINLILGNVGSGKSSLLKSFIPNCITKSKGKFNIYLTFYFFLSIVISVLFFYFRARADLFY